MNRNHPKPKSLNRQGRLLAKSQTTPRFSFRTPVVSAVYVRAGSTFLSHDTRVFPVRKEQQVTVQCFKREAGCSVQPTVLQGLGPFGNNHSKRGHTLSGRTIMYHPESEALRSRLSRHPGKKRTRGYLKGASEISNGNDQ